MTEKTDAQLAKELLQCEGWTLLFVPRMLAIIKPLEDSLTTQRMSLEDIAGKQAALAALTDLLGLPKRIAGTPPADT